MARHIAIDQGASSDHFGVQQRMAREQAVKVSTVVIRPIHHRRDT
jgi:hypothetical protein